MGDLPGASRFMPVSVESDQLLCFPEPLSPAKGFSCSRHTMPWRSEVFFIISITSWLWSVAVLESANTGASSYWPGATSLCSVLANTPSCQSSVSRSRMK